MDMDKLKSLCPHLTVVKLKSLCSRLLMVEPKNLLKMREKEYRRYLS